MRRIRVSRENVSNLNMTTPNTNTAVTKTGGDKLKGLLTGAQFKDAVAQVLPKHLTADRFIRVAIMAMTKTPKLAECDQASFFSALMMLSQLGIEPDGRRAHLIPYGTTVQLIVDYKGIAELVMRSGLVSNLHADVVCENDIFTVDRGELKEHKIDYRKPRGEVYAVYALCRFKDGTEKCEVMTREEVEAVRARSRAGRAGPWVSDWAEMAKKTVFRRLSKWLPFSPEQREGIEADDNQFEAPIKPASRKGLFGSDGFELPAPAIDVPSEPEDDVSYTPHSAAPVEEKPAPKAATPKPTAPKPELVNDKTRLAQWMDERGFGWGQLQPIISREIGNWADAVGSFEDLNAAQSKAIYTARAAIESALVPAAS